MINAMDNTIVKHKWYNFIYSVTFYNELEKFSDIIYMCNNM